MSELGTVYVLGQPFLVDNGEEFCHQMGESPTWEHRLWAEGLMSHEGHHRRAFIAVKAGMDLHYMRETLLHECVHAADHFTADGDNRMSEQETQRIGRALFSMLEDPRNRWMVDWIVNGIVPAVAKPETTETPAFTPRRFVEKGEQGWYWQTEPYGKIGLYVNGVRHGDSAFDLSDLARDNGHFTEVPIPAETPAPTCGTCGGTKRVHMAPDGGVADPALYMRPCPACATAEGGVA